MTSVRLSGNWEKVPFEDDQMKNELATMGLASFEQMTEYSLYSEGTNETSTKPKKDSSTVKKKKKRKLKQKEEIVTKPRKRRRKETATSPQPSTSSVENSAWSDLFVPEPVQRALKDLGFRSPTDIQSAVLPVAIRDRVDIIGAAETGSGKSIAFGVPILQRIMECEGAEYNGRLLAVILSPTRELAIQLRDHLRAIGTYCNVKIEAIVGGLSIEKQERLIRKKPQIIVATPGRLWELMDRGNKYLNDVGCLQALVIDEADRLFEANHFQELSNIIAFLNSKKSSKRQNFMFSATLTFAHSGPERVLKKGKKKKVITSQQKVANLVSQLGLAKKPKIIDLSKKSITADALTETKINCSKDEKDLYLYYFLLKHSGRTLVFANSIDCIRRLTSIFKILDRKPVALHASMHQKQRLRNLEHFSSNSDALLLATDVAARGLDIANVDHVVHYQIPPTTESYVHRSGRTARAKQEGLSVALVSSDDVKNYRKIVANLKREIPDFEIEHNVLQRIRKRVSLALEIDGMEHRFMKYKKQNDWYRKAAKQMDIEIDDHLLHDLGSDDERNKREETVTDLKAELKELLKERLRFTTS